jgi:hypothetical protein
MHNDLVFATTTNTTSFPSKDWTEPTISLCTPLTEMGEQRYSSIHPQHRFWMEVSRFTPGHLTSSTHSTVRWVGPGEGLEIWRQNSLPLTVNKIWFLGPLAGSQVNIPIELTRNMCRSSFPGQIRLYIPSLLWSAKLVSPLEQFSPQD